MKIVPSIIIFLCLVDLLRGQSEVDDNSETEVMGDSGWWSRRITKINRKEEERIGLENEDNQRRASRRWQEKTKNRDLRRRPRPFASSILHRNPDIQNLHRFESRREHFRNDNEVIVDLTGLAAPSPILLPPYATPSPVYRNNIFDKEPRISRWNNESSSYMGKSSISSAPERRKINEITTSNSTNNEMVEIEPSYEDDSSDSFNENNPKNLWMDFDRETYVNETRMRIYGMPRERNGEEKLGHSIYIDEKPGNERTFSFETTANRNNPLKSPRGNRRYQDDFKDLQSFMRKDFSRSDRYHWRPRTRQRSNHFILNDDSSKKIGSVPGIAGRDYPIHQEHTHHHLRNTADRFPCPRTPKTHVYLADRASRCQIFYVCYGSTTGVPMVCPNGTLFSEPLQVCDWWFNVSC